MPAKSIIHRYYLEKAIDIQQAWSLDTYDLVLSVHAHKESVLGLDLSEDGDLLFSSGGDSVVNVSSLSARRINALIAIVGLVYENI